jgi:hypothetical protein
MIECNAEADPVAQSLLSLAEAEELFQAEMKCF